MSRRIHSVPAAVGGAIMLALTAGSTAAEPQPEGPPATEPRLPASLGSATLYAVVNENGTFVRRNGARAVQRLGEGEYEVIFSRNVRACVYVGTIAEIDNETIPPAGQISVNGRDNNVRGVFVQTRNGSGNPGDRPFHLLVIC